MAKKYIITLPELSFVLYKMVAAIFYFFDISLLYTFSTMCYFYSERNNSTKSLLFEGQVQIF